MNYKICKTFMLSEILKTIVNRSSCHYSFTDNLSERALLLQLSRNVQQIWQVTTSLFSNKLTTVSNFKLTERIYLKLLEYCSKKCFPSIFFVL